MKYNLYPDQEECVNAICNYKSKQPGIVLAPTGFGKSIVISAVAKKLGGGILVLHLSKELLKQNVEKFSHNKIEFSVYSASVNSREVGSITFATLKSIKNDVQALKDAGISTVLIDECDRNFATAEGSEFRKFIEELNPDRVIGLTATPWKTEVTPFGPKIKLLTECKDVYYKRFIFIGQIQSIIESGRWTPCEYLIHDFDDSGLKLNSISTDYTDESVQRVNEDLSINKAIAKEVKRCLEAGYKHILVFVDSTTNAEKFSKWLPNNSAYLHSSMYSKTRDEVVNKFKSGEINVLFNFGILSVGFDMPELEVIIMGRPTGSLSLYYQIYGRGVRKYEGKKSFLFSDFGGNVSRFGMIENLTMSFKDGNGYFLTSGDRVLSDTYLGTNVSIEEFFKPKKEKFIDLDKGFQIKHGKYSGKKVMAVPVFALKWMVNNVSPNNSYYEKLISECKKALLLKESLISKK